VSVQRLAAFRAAPRQSAIWAPGGERVATHHGPTAAPCGAFHQAAPERHIGAEMTNASPAHWSYRSLAALFITPRPSAISAPK